MIFRKGLIRVTLATLTLAVSSFAADATLVNLIPADAKSVAGVNVDRAVGSAFGQYVLQEMAEKDKKGGLAKLEDATGFDPRRDLREVLMVSTGAPGTGKLSNSLVLVRANIDVTRVVAHARKEGATITNYKEATIIADPNRSGEAWVAMVDGLAVIGNPENVKAALDRRAQPSQTTAAMRAKIQDLSGRYDAWMHTLVPTGTFPSAVPGNHGNTQLNPQVLQAIEQASAGVHFGSNVEIGAEAVTRSDRDATALADVLRFVASMAQTNMKAPEAQHISALLDSMQLNTSANVVTVKMTVPQTQIEQFIKSKTTVKKASLR
jgi:hypothetical protein